jgi:hypothetical protein
LNNIESKVLPFKSKLFKLRAEQAAGAHLAVVVPMTVRARNSLGPGLWTLILLILISPGIPLRVLVVTIDHRELDGELRNASHQSLSAVINYNYAKLHGYDYKYYHPVINETAVRIKYGLKSKPVMPVVVDSTEHHEGGEESGGVSDRAAAAASRRRRKVAQAHAFHDETPTAFHPGLKEFRGSSWCRLPTLWHLTKLAAAEDKYDALFVIDSDLVISAIHQNITVEQKLQEWQSRADGVTWGPKDLEKAAIIFFPNSPFGNWEPATGILLIRPKLLLGAADMIKEWWDFEWPEKSFSLMHEQDALWRVYQWSPQSVFKLNQEHTSMVSEKQFPVDMTVDEWCFRRAWICHVSHSWGKERNRVFHRILHSEVVHHGTKARLSSDAHQVATFFHDTIALIRGNEVQFDVVAAAEEMEAKGGQRKRIGNHIAQNGELPAPVGSPSSSNPSTSSDQTSASVSVAPTTLGKAAVDPEERNNEFHNLNPSAVEVPTKEQWASFKTSMDKFVAKMKALKNDAGGATGGATPKANFNVAAAELYRNFSLGRITYDRFEREWAQWNEKKTKTTTTKLL